jgi:hypothetical protein
VLLVSGGRLHLQRMHSPHSFLALRRLRIKLFVNGVVVSGDDLDDTVLTRRQCRGQGYEPDDPEFNCLAAYVEEEWLPHSNLVAELRADVTAFRQGELQPLPVELVAERSRCRK